MNPILSELLKKIPGLKIETDPQELKSLGTDWTSIHEPHPLGAVFPSTTIDVAEILKICNQYKISVVPSGGRTGLAGGAVAARGELILSLRDMRKIDRPDVLSSTLRVQAGAITEAVHQACEPFGLTWPVDFGSKGSSTVGGNIATNAGGINVIRYGMTRNWVLGLTVVTMTGGIMQLNGALEKNNTGLDLKHLFIGSEGILGVVTEATLKLTKIQDQFRLFFFALESLDSVFNLLASARSGPFDIYAYEIFSNLCFEASLKHFNTQSPFTKTHEFYVLLKVRGEESKVDAWLEQCFETAQVAEGVEPQSAAEVKTFWKLRESIAEVLASLGLNHSNDVSVPIFSLQKFLQDWQILFKQKYPDWVQYVYGHIGDGNLHIHALKPESMPTEEFLLKTKTVDLDLFALVKKYHGSISAEHGVGLLKKQYLSFSKTDEELLVLRVLKAHFDPQGLLNPGKVIDR